MTFFKPKMIIIAIIVILNFNSNVINTQYTQHTDQSTVCPIGQYRKFLDIDFNKETDANIMYYCFDCHISCKRCVGKEKTDCTACKNFDRIKEFTPDNQFKFKCLCPIGSFENDQLECQQCNSQCSSCVDGQDCLTCVDPRMQPPRCSLPSSGFAPSFETNGQPSNVLITCPINCKSCSDANTCIECLGKNRYLNPPECACQVGYHDNKETQQNCEKCAKYCLECIAHNLCTKCENKRVMDPFTGSCICPAGQKEFSGECKKFYQLLDSFVSICPKNAKVDEKNQICIIDYQNTNSTASFIFMIAGAICFVQIALFLCVWKCLQSKEDNFEAKKQQHLRDLLNKKDKEEEEGEENEKIKEQQNELEGDNLVSGEISPKEQKGEEDQQAIAEAGNSKHTNNINVGEEQEEEEQKQSENDSPMKRKGLKSEIDESQQDFSILDKSDNRLLNKMSSAQTLAPQGPKTIDFSNNPFSITKQQKLDKENDNNDNSNANIMDISHAEAKKNNFLDQTQL